MTNAEPAIDQADLPILDAGLRREPDPTRGHVYDMPLAKKPVLNPPANDNHPSLWKATANHARLRHEERCLVSKRTFPAKRAVAFEWDVKPANDNYWPLMKALQSAQAPEPDRNRLAAAAIRYREIYDAVHSGMTLGGTSVEGEPVQLDQRTYIGGDGALQYKGQRKLTALGEGDQAPTKNQPGTKKSLGAWTGDASLNAAIDARPVLDRMQAALGPLLRPVEDAVLHGRPHKDIGKSEGFENEAQAIGASKALVHRGLRVIAGELRL